MLLLWDLPSRYALAGWSMATAYIYEWVCREWDYAQEARGRVWLMRSLGDDPELAG